MRSRRRILWLAETGTNMNPSDDAHEDATPEHRGIQDGEIQDAIYRGPSPDQPAPPPTPPPVPPAPSIQPPSIQPPSIQLGSAIGRDFDSPAETILPVPPPPASVAVPAPNAGYSTPAEPAVYPATEPVFTTDSGSSKLPWVAAVIAAVVLLGGGAFFAASAFGASGGAASPDEGIEAVLGAVGNEDFVTLAELMEPTERRTIAEPAITEVLPQLVRLGVLEDSVDAGDVEGVDVVFTDVEYRVERLVGVDDIAHVYLTGGEFATNVNSALLPFTDEIDTTGFDQQDRQTITESDTPIVFVERDGDWYFSLWFTIAENARIAAGERLPSADESPEPIPSDSPQAAIEGMFNSLTSFDLAAVVGHMDPEEMAVLYRYSPLFLDDAQASLNELQGDLRDDGVTWEMTDFDFDVEQDGNDAIVTIRGFVANFAVDDVDIALTYSRDDLSGQFSVDGVTGTLNATTTDYEVSGQFDDSSFEANVSVEPEINRISGTVGIEGDSFDGELVLDPTGACSRFEISGTDGTNESGCIEEETGFDGLAPILEAMEEWPTEFPGFAMRTRQVDGGWFISPVSSMFDAAVSSLEELEEGDFDDVFDPFAGIVGDASADPFGIIEEGSDFTDAIDDSQFEQDEVFDTFADPALEQDTPISVGDGEVAQFEGEIAANGFDTYSIELEAGSTVVVTAQQDGGDLDTTLRVVDPSGNQLAFNDDASAVADLPSSRDSQVIFIVENTGLHIFEVAGFSAQSSGPYLLTVDRASDGIVDAEGETEPDNSTSPLVDTTAISVASGEELNIAGAVVEPVGYDIEVDAGDELVITVERVEGGTLDPVVTLLLGGVEVGRNDDAEDSTAVADSFDSQLIVTVGETGTHTILVEGFAGATGDFIMRVERN